MREHHAFGHARAAAGENYSGEIIGFLTGKIAAGQPGGG